MNQNILEFQKAISDAGTLLLMNTEWVLRYSDYASDIDGNLDNITTVRKSFHEWNPLKLYLNVSNAKIAKAKVRFNVRYLGQAVADIEGSSFLKISTKKYDTKSLRDFGCNIALHDTLWRSPSATAFRNFFKSHQASFNKGNEEHRLESLLISELSKTKDKLLFKIKPITISGLRFPMPTPLKASNHKSISYAGYSGGGIDIFARTGIGRDTHLCVIELKDQNTLKEPPKEAIKQALAYTKFIRELLRSPSGKEWYKLFGFSGDVPKKLIIYAACAMPNGKNNDSSFAKQKLNLGGEDEVVLHYIYFDEFNNKITNIITSIE